jgi:hypothetical protein
VWQGGTLSAVTTMPTEERLDTDCSCTCEVLSIRIGGCEVGREGVYEAEVGQEVLVVDGPWRELEACEKHFINGFVALFRETRRRPGRR